MVSPVLGATGPSCRMIFRYHQGFINGAVTFIINLVRSTGTTKWSKQLLKLSSMSYTTWISYSAQIGSLPAGYQIEISGLGIVTTNTQPYADMEIDEIQFVNCDTNNTSPSQNLTCDFETDTCGWTDMGIATNNKLDWVRILIIFIILNFLLMG